MIIINKAAQGENTYVVSIQTGTAHTEDFQVYADSDKKAIDAVADYLDGAGAENLYFDPGTLAAIAECSNHKTLAEFAEARGLTKCGRRGIYLALANVEEEKQNDNDRQ